MRCESQKLEFVFVEVGFGGDFEGATVVFCAAYDYQRCFDYFAANPPAKDARLYFLSGEEEGGSMVPDVKKVFASISNADKPNPNAALKIVPRARHNEAFWSSEFEQAVLWLFAADK